MFEAWMQRWWVNKWVILLTSNSVWCFQVIKTGELFCFHNKAVFPTKLAEPLVVEEIKQLIPKRSGLIICLPSEVVELQSFNLDPKLSRAEKYLFIKSNLSRAMKADGEAIAFSFEKFALSSSGATRLLVAAVEKKHLNSLSKLTSEHECNCIRLESTQATIAWWANKQRTQNKSRYWGVVEFSYHRLSLLLLEQQQVLCQKSFLISSETGDSMTNMLQRIKQVISLLKIDQSVSLFCSPPLFNLLPIKKISGVCDFHSLSSFDSELQTELEFNEVQMHYLALAITAKAYELK